MKIRPNQVFLHGKDRYEPRDEPYDVPLELGYYFCNNGWADSAEVPTGESTTEVVDLDIQTAYLNQKSRFTNE